MEQLVEQYAVTEHVTIFAVPGRIGVVAVAGGHEGATIWGRCTTGEM
jgi:hypothetical protein